MELENDIAASMRRGRLSGIFGNLQMLEQKMKTEKYYDPENLQIITKRR
jgi:hypothetical protein